MASARAILALTCAKDEEPERFVVPFDARARRYLMPQQR